MRRFILGWRVLGYARRFKAHIVNYADDFVVLGQAPPAVMRAAVESLMERLKLTVNAEKTRCCRVPEESTRLLHKSWHVVVTQAPAFSVARAWRSSPSSLSLLFIDRIALPAGRMMRPAR